MKTPANYCEIWQNPNQGDRPRALFICSAGILRSPTCAHWTAANLQWNTRSCGLYPDAIPCCTPPLLKWASVIYCMEEKHKDGLIHKFDAMDTWPVIEPKIMILDIPDNYNYMDPDLVAILRQKFIIGK